MCFSMYSLMSSAMSEFSSPNRNSASVLASSVLPTPVGPRKMNEPLGRFGSFRPARVRRTLWLTALMAFSWPMMRLCSSPSMLSSFGGLFLGELVHRDAGPDAEHLGDGLFVDLVEQVDAAGLDLGLLGGLLLEQRLLLVAQAAGFLEALLLDGALLGLLHVGELAARSPSDRAACPCA